MNCLGVLAIAGSFAAQPWTDHSALALLLGLMVVAEYLQVRVYEARQETLSFSLGVAVTMAAVSWQPESAPLVALCGALVHVLRNRRAALAKTLFNIANNALAAALASLVYVGVTHAPIDLASATPIAGGFLAGATYLGANLGSISWMISRHSGKPFMDVLRDTGWIGPTNMLLGLTGVYLGGAHRELGVLGTSMFALPVIVMRFTLAFYARRSRRTIQTLEGQADQLEQQAQQMKHLALNDSLTSLPNRIRVHEWLAELLADPEQPVALLLLDLDRFKEVNDTFGHQFGDRLLQQVGPRLESAIGALSQVGRPGGDEFTVVLTGIAAASAEEFAEAARRAIAEPFVLGDQTLYVTASVGIAARTPLAEDAATLFRQADVAMYVAKERRSGTVRYAASLDRHSPQRLRLVSDLRAAIEQDGLELVFQPQVDSATGRVSSMEALARWRHPELGYVSPAEFVSLAEHTGLIQPLTRWVLRAAAAHCRRWLDTGRRLTVSVNISAHDLEDPAFPDVVTRLVQEAGSPAHLIRLEITEGAMMAHPDQAIDALRRLRAYGFHLSIDDFGTGYSSLAYLKQLPVDELKIDRSFVRDMVANPDDAAIVDCAIRLGHALRIAVVAEGVEDQDTADLLRRLGCDLLQGYVYSKPCSPTELEPLLALRAATQRAA